MHLKSETPSFSQWECKKIRERFESLLSLCRIDANSLTDALNSAFLAGVALLHAFELVEDSLLCFANKEVVSSSCHAVEKLGCRL